MLMPMVVMRMTTMICNVMVDGAVVNIITDVFYREIPKDNSRIFLKVRKD